MITTATGSTWAFITALALIAAWAVTGPLFQFSNAWQLGINTATTIVTFLMVFIIQQSQNKQGLAIQLKLNELIAADHAASNRLIDVEELTEDELNQLHTFYRHLIERTKKERPLTKSHSIEEIAHEQGLPKLKPQDTGT
jgi:low affinity Fe/Cu permease